jgi:hypothetical protein
MPAARVLWRKTHPIRNGAALPPMEPSAAGNGITPPPHRAGRSSASPGKRRPNSETKPIAADVVQS